MRYRAHVCQTIVFMCVRLLRLFRIELHHSIGSVLASLVKAANETIIAQDKN